MGSFADVNKKFMDDFLNGVDKTVRESSIEHFGNIIDDSPIKTGAFVGGWKINDTSWELIPLSKDTVKSKVTADVNRLKTLDEFFMSNTAPYGERLEFGWSQQAPSGMLRLNELKWRNILDTNGKKYLP